MKLSNYVRIFDAMDAQANSYALPLTSDQQKIHDKVLNEYADKNIRVAVLDASSGSGKTTTIRAIVKTAVQRGISVTVTATTGKASSALGGKTIHSFLGLKMITNDEATSADEALLLTSSDIVSEKPSILIIDESSMIGMKLFRQIKKQGFNYILFVLDSSQLPPVKDTKIEWSEEANSYHFLTKTLRAQDPAMLKLFEDFKEYRDGRMENLDLRNYVNNRNIVEIDYSDFDFIPKNSDSCTVAYRNAIVEDMASQITSKGHNKYNLNSGVQITKMVAKGEQDSRGYYKRDFVNEVVLYNGEDVKIDILSGETSAIQSRGYCYYGDYKISMSKNGNNLMVGKSTETAEDKYLIKFPIDSILEHCVLAIVEDKYFVLMWDKSEQEYKEAVDDLFKKLHPKLKQHREVLNFIANKPYDESIIGYEVKNIMSQGLSRDDFLEAYALSRDSTSRKEAWSDFLSAKSVITARHTTSRTIHKSQGISIPCVIITNNSFFGASLSAQYVAATRAKYGVILVNNVPKTITEKDLEDEEIHNY